MAGEDAEDGSGPAWGEGDPGGFGEGGRGFAGGFPAQRTFDEGAGKTGIFKDVLQVSPEDPEEGLSSGGTGDGLTSSSGEAPKLRKRLFAGRTGRTAGRRQEGQCDQRDQRRGTGLHPVRAWLSGTGEFYL